MGASWHRLQPPQPSFMRHLSATEKSTEVQIGAATALGNRQDLVAKDGDTMGYPQTLHEKYHKKVMKMGYNMGIPRKLFVDVCLIGQMMIQQRMELGNLPFQSNPHAKCETKTGTKKK